MKFFMVEWWEPKGETRPITFPPHKDVIFYRIKKIRGSVAKGDLATQLTAYVIADDEKSAREVIQTDWPGAGEWSPAVVKTRREVFAEVNHFKADIEAWSRPRLQRLH